MKPSFLLLNLLLLIQLPPILPHLLFILFSFLIPPHIHHILLILLFILNLQILHIIFPLLLFNLLLMNKTTFLLLIIILPLLNCLLLILILLQILYLIFLHLDILLEPLNFLANTKIMWFPSLPKLFLSLLSLPMWWLILSPVLIIKLNQKCYESRTPGPWNKLYLGYHISS